jgi:hypothetical protein
MARKYAEGTTVAVEKSQNQIRRFLTDRGATNFGMAFMEGQGAQIVCSLNGRQLRFSVRSAEDDKEERRLWRVLFMRIKLRWEEFTEGEVKFDEAFISFIVLPDNKTMADHCLPAIEQAYKDGKMPQLRLEYK